MVRCEQYTAVTTLVVAVVSSVAFLVLEREGSLLADSLLCLGDCDQCVFGWTSNRCTPHTYICLET